MVYTYTMSQAEKLRKKLTEIIAATDGAIKRSKGPEFKRAELEADERALRLTENKIAAFIKELTAFVQTAGPSSPSEDDRLHEALKLAYLTIQA